uniref:Uncharacterized protein n=1 Tax=Meloidogyne enterolobii TaxID=390850 RepID=A0A6V7V3T2_MELEN|nr:unnamed protein product [Meloidogyne enterolobii]
MINGSYRAKTRNGQNTERQNMERQNEELPKRGTTKIRTIPKRGTDRTRTCQNTERPKGGTTKTRSRQIIIFYDFKIFLIL